MRIRLATAAALLAAFLPASVSYAGEGNPVPVFIDVAKEKGLGGQGGEFVLWCDYDGDGDVDLLAGGTALFRNTGPPDYRFEAAGSGTGLDRIQGRGMFVDFDNDGDMDLATTAGGMWISDGGRFSPASPELGFDPPKRCSAMAWFDADGDGWLDVYFTVSEEWNEGNAKFFPHRLLRNVAGKRFEDATAPLPTAERGAYGRCVSACDFDLDGDFDLYVGNYRLQSNFLLRNAGKGRFEESAFAIGVAGSGLTHNDRASGRTIGPYYGHTIGAAWADFNNDGLFDLFVANLVHKYVGTRPNGERDIRGYICDDSKIYMNLGGPGFRFEDRRAGMGVPPRPVGGQGEYKGDELWSNVVCGDFDNDGFADAFVTQIYDLPYAHALLYRNVGGARFQEVGVAAGVRVFNTYGAAWADFDDDGSLDLAAMGQDGANERGDKEAKLKPRLHLFRNPGAAGNWIRFDLRSAAGNRIAAGAQVVVKSCAGLMARQVEIGTGSHGQQNDPRLHFGMGAESRPVWVLVRWGGGLSQFLKPTPETGRTHVLIEPVRPAFSIAALRAERKSSLEAEIWVEGTNLEGRAYLWDLDGNGAFERVSGVPRIEAGFPSPGPRFIRVLALDRETAVGLEACVVADVY